MQGGPTNAPLGGLRVANELKQSRLYIVFHAHSQTAGVCLCKLFDKIMTSQV